MLCLLPLVATLAATLAEDLQTTAYWCSGSGTSTTTSPLAGGGGWCGASVDCGFNCIGLCSEYPYSLAYFVGGSCGAYNNCSANRKLDFQYLPIFHNYHMEVLFDVPVPTGATCTKFNSKCPYIATGTSSVSNCFGTVSVNGVATGLYCICDTFDSITNECIHFNVCADGQPSAVPTSMPTLAPSAPTKKPKTARHSKRPSKAPKTSKPTKFYQ